MANETQDRTDGPQEQLGCAAAFIALATCFVALRFLAHFLQTSRRVPLGWNEGLILAALVVYIPMCAFAIVNAQAYMTFYSSYDETIQDRSFVTIFKTSYTISVLYPLASTLPKLSLCAFYIRIFDVSSAVRRITYATILLLIANSIAWLAPTIFVCRPISAFWSLDGHVGKCLNYNVFGTWISLPNLFTDVVMLVLPIPILWKTQMSVPKKLGLIVTFAVGSAGMVGACLRLALYVHRLYFQSSGETMTTKSMAINMIVTLLECGMYLIAACLPSQRIICVQIHRIISSSVSSLLHRRPSYQSSEGSNEKELDKFSDKMPADKVFVKLTGIGKLDTLAREGQHIGVSRMESGLWSARHTMIEDDTDDSESGDDVHQVCHVCHMPQLPQRHPRVPAKSGTFNFR